MYGHPLRILGERKNLSGRDGAARGQVEAEVRLSLAGEWWANQSGSGELMGWIKGQVGIEREIAEECVDSVLADALRRVRSPP